MEVKLFILAALASILAVPIHAASEVTSFVEVLNQDTFDEATKEGFWLVEFYAPWCGHCKVLNPILDEISEQTLAGGMHIGKVDTTKNKKITDKFGISGYPSLKFRLLPGDEWRTYEGGRKGKDFLAFAERMKGEPLPSLQSAADLEELLARSKANNGTGVAFVFGGGHGRSSWLNLAGTAARSVQHKTYCGVVAPGAKLAWSGAAGPGTGTTELPGDGQPYLAALENGEAPRFYPGQIPVDTQAATAAAAAGGGSNGGGGGGGGGGSADPSPARSAKVDTKFLEDWMKANDAPLFVKFGAANFRKLGKLGKKLVIAIADPGNATTTAFLSGVQQVARTLSTERASLDNGAEAAKALNAALGGRGSGGEEAEAAAVAAAVKAAEVRMAAALKAAGGVVSWEVAGALADAFQFGHLDGVKWKDFVEQFNVYGDLPRLVVMDMPKEVFYEDRSVDEADEIETFLRQVHAGKVPAQREGYQGSVKRFLAKVNDMGWRFYAMALPLVLSLLAFCFTKPADDDGESPSARRAKKAQ